MEIDELKRAIKEAAKRGDMEKVAELTQKLVSKVLEETKGAIPSEIKENIKETIESTVKEAVEIAKKEIKNASKEISAEEKGITLGIKIPKEKTEGLEDLEDIVTLKLVLKTISEEVPKIIKGTLEGVLSEDSGRRLGKMIGEFYKSLQDQGIPKELALELTKKMAEKVISNTGMLSDFINVMKSAVSGGKKKTHWVTEEEEEEGRDGEEEGSS